jgi:hypothetical protein
VLKDYVFMSNSLALFPLSQIVLPEGQMRLRIFEPRYQRLVREATSGKRAFASALLNPYVAADHPDRIFPIVTEVRVIDFCQLDDGLLGITIEGVCRRRILKRWQEIDMLHVADTELISAWPVEPVPDNYAYLGKQLQQIYAQYPELGELYQTPKWQDACWLSQRWLEILTMQPPLKHQLISAPDANATLEALHEWFQSAEQDDDEARPN